MVGLIDDEYKALLRRLRADGFRVRLTCLAAPVQLEGHLPTGEAFYFRSRHETARLQIAPRRGDAVAHPTWEASFSDPAWGHEDASVLSADEAEAILRRLLGRYHHMQAAARVAHILSTEPADSVVARTAGALYSDIPYPGIDAEAAAGEAAIAADAERTDERL